MPETILTQLAPVTREAGRILLTHYQSPGLVIRRKADRSQVTDADLASSAYLAKALPKIWAAPVMCEEAVVPFETRRHWKEYWLVDPLDGTKDFLAGEKDFTVCIALITNGQPRIGVIFAPVLDELFEAESGEGSFVTRAGKRTRLATKGGLPWAAVRSRFHDAGETTTFLERNRVENTIAVGSALKFGRIAEGMGNLFPRLRGCHEWDVAAGQIIVAEAGGALCALPSGGPLFYNTPEAMVSPFVAVGNAADFAKLRF